MKLAFRTKTLEGLQVQKHIFAVVILMLTLSNIFLVVSLVNKTDRWILIPQYNTSHRVVVTSDGYSDDYLIDWADSSLRNLLTVNPNTVNRQNRLFSEFSNDTRAVNVFLKAHKTFIQDNDASSAFYPKTFDVDSKNKKISVTGDFQYRFGNKKDLIEMTKKFEVQYHMGPQGLLLVQGVKETVCE